MSRYFMNALQAVGATCFSRLPGLCGGCGQVDSARVCKDCVMRFIPPGPRCPRCAARGGRSDLICGSCLHEPPAFEASWAAVDYGFPWAKLIAQFKFREGLDLAACFADLMLAHGPSPHSPARLLLPVPLGKARIRQRGFNQSWELARRLGRSLDWPARSDALLKTRDTPEQMSLPVHRRSSNLKGVFSLAPGAREALQGQRVILVDDVMTTGATLDTLAQIVKQAGAASVEAWVFARTPPPHLVSP